MLFTRSIIVFCIFILFIRESSFAQKINEYIQYLHPKANAEYVSCQSNVIIRFQKKWRNYLNINILNIQVKGSLSGEHEGKIFQGKDHLTFFFQPSRYFISNEEITVTISVNLSGLNKKMSYSFVTSKGKDPESFQIEDESIQEVQAQQLATYGERTVINGVTVPSDFPKINIDILEGTAEGRLFVTNTDGVPYIMILENDGSPYFYQRLPGASGDFKVQPSGTITRVGWPRSMGFFEMDSNYKVIDTLACGNGYKTDTHEIQLFSNGNYLVIALDEQTIDMSQYVEGGKINATVIGNHIQELDRDGNVIFEWRSWDHYNIIDAVNEDLTASTIDYVHMNAIAVDYDGHLLVSARNLNEITKINHETGDIIWRLGGVNNQFNFITDDSISYQHDIRPVPGKENHYTLFDNGRYHSPRFSRAVEFLIDTTIMTATKVWEYRPTPDRYSNTRGNVQRLSNGNTLIDWSGGTLPIASEVSPEGEVVYEFSFFEKWRTYRTFRFDWNGTLQVPYLIAEAYTNKVSLIYNKFGDDDIAGYVIYADQEPDPIIPIDTTTNTWIDLIDLENYKTYYFRVTVLDSSGEESGFSNQEEVFVKYIDPGDNIILNGDFPQNEYYWKLTTSNRASATSYIEDSICHLIINDAGSSFKDVQYYQENLTLVQGKEYLFEFDGYSTENRIIEAKIEKKSPPFDNYSKTSSILLYWDLRHYKFRFKMEHVSDFNARVVFNVGENQNDIFIDNVSLKEIVPSAIPGENDLLPKSYKLYKNYPNPFNPVTIINYQLPMTNNIELSIYNILGQRVGILVSEKQQAGHYQVEWDASGFASGIYYYMMEVCTSTGVIVYKETRKMMIIK